MRTPGYYLRHIHAFLQKSWILSGKLEED